MPKDETFPKTLEEIAAFVLPPIEDLKAYWDATCNGVMEFLEKQSAEDFDGTADYALRPGSTLGDLFATGEAHLLEHVGQMVYVRILLRGETRLN